jgi:hypothetical protein
MSFMFLDIETYMLGSRLGSATSVDGDLERDAAAAASSWSTNARGDCQWQVKKIKLKAKSCWRQN